MPAKRHWLVVLILAVMNSTMACYWGVRDYPCECPSDVDGGVER